MCTPGAKDEESIEGEADLGDIAEVGTEEASNGVGG